MKKYNDRSPRLKTVKMVARFVKKNSGKYKKTALFRNLPKEMMSNTFDTVLEHLE